MALPERLKNETRDLHARAERSGAMRLLLCGGLDRAQYCALLRALHAIYEGLEAALAQHAPHPLVSPVCLPGLARTERLVADLRTLHGESWQQDLAVPAAARRYARRLRLLARWQPPLLTAHAYVRYLGDLHGGQVLKRLVASTYALETGTGTSFYDFGDRDTTQALIRDFRQGLGEIGVRDLAIEAPLVREARHAFQAHCHLFEALAPAPA